MKIAMLSTFTPRQCGIATFTSDLINAIQEIQPYNSIVGVAMNDHQQYEYGQNVQVTIEQDSLASYEEAAHKLNELKISVLCVQHEFGIFGGVSGSYLLTLLRAVKAPIVTTLHTVLENFTLEQAQVIEELALLSSKIIVMSNKAVQFLLNQGVSRSKIVFIHHGIPFIEGDRITEKQKLGLLDRPLVLTFGLLSPNKGIETAIRALPKVVAEFPNLTYLVLGATHPNIRAREGERYRNELKQLAEELGVADNVRFDNKFANIDELVGAISAADVYLVPYLNKEQITSGTLAYAVGSGKAVVSTPFWYAEELLSEGRGSLVPFKDYDAISDSLVNLLKHPHQRYEIEQKAKDFGKQMRWPNVARLYVSTFELTTRNTHNSTLLKRVPILNTDHMMTMTDDTGVLQHAIMSIPNLFEGYTIDDNARGLQLAVLAATDPNLSGKNPNINVLTRRTLSFIHYAYNKDQLKFHNFMSFNRTWLDDAGGENAQARTFRALIAAVCGLSGSLQQTANEILQQTHHVISDLVSPRAQAIALIGISEYVKWRSNSPDLVAQLNSIAERYAGNLKSLYEKNSVPTWCWYEDFLTYSNAKIPHALIAYGYAFNDNLVLTIGCESLNWLETQQTDNKGDFLPIGSDRLYKIGEARPLWDGQPIEVYATVSASLEAYRATNENKWLVNAKRALDWLLGSNALGLSLHNLETNGCRDGLHKNGLNYNEGAESTLALWLSVAEYQQASKTKILYAVNSKV